MLLNRIFSAIISTLLFLLFLVGAFWEAGCKALELSGC